jgi:hypothetical protein
VKLNPICEEKATEERMRGERKSSEKKCKSTRKPAGGRGIISGLAARVFAGSFFKMPIFSVLSSSFSWTLVWT